MRFVNKNVSKQVAVRNEFFFFGISSALLSVLFCSVILFSVYMLTKNGNITSGSLVMIAAFLFQIFLPMNQAGFVFRQIKMARADIDLYCTETEDVIPSNTLPSPFADRTHLSAITEWLKRFGFDKPLNHVIRGFGSNLSGGPKKKLGVMLSYGKPYSLIVFDEPTKGFDESGVNAFREYLMHETRDKYVLVITHDERLLGSCSDTSIVRMNNNKELAC
ncbi:hypothetical protein AAGR22_07985 [Erwinia sp. HDF1-3R]|uniref:hypothetical protein n=1 Tax=Erwinia sp. HDF1-3R TaxID=3141543 RepID=UPI0031F5534E